MVARAVALTARAAAALTVMAVVCGDGDGGDDNDDDGDGGDDDGDGSGGDGEGGGGVATAVVAMAARRLWWRRRRCSCTRLSPEGDAKTTKLAAVWLHHTATSSPAEVAEGGSDVGRLQDVEGARRGTLTCGDLPRCARRRVVKERCMRPPVRRGSAPGGGSWHKVAPMWAGCDVEGATCGTPAATTFRRGRVAGWPRSEA